MLIKEIKQVGMHFLWRGYMGKGSGWKERGRGNLLVCKILKKCYINKNKIFTQSPVVKHTLILSNHWSQYQNLVDIITLHSYAFRIVHSQKIPDTQ